LFKFLIILILSVSSFMAFSAERIELYESQVPVLDQSAEQRQLGFERAFRNVVQKVTGKVAFSQSGELLEQLGSSSKLVKSYVYLTNPDYNSEQAEIAAAQRALMLENGDQGAVRDTLAMVDSEIAENLVRVTFSGPSVEQKIRELGLPFWGALRPELLAWVVYEQAANRSLLSSSDSVYSGDVERAATEVGLPVFLPVGDLEDFGNIDLNEIWGLFPSAVDDASNRYQLDLNFVARVAKVNDIWQAAWAMNLGASQVSGRVAEASHNEMWLALMQGVASELSDRYAVLASTEAGSYKVSVAGVKTFSDYVQVRQHLRSLSTVKSVAIEAVNGEVLSLDIVLLGTPDQFDQQVEFGQKLMRDLSAPALNPAQEVPKALPRQDAIDTSNMTVSPSDERVVLYGAGREVKEAAESSVGLGSTASADSDTVIQSREPSEASDPRVKKNLVARYIWRSTL
jgi:uncharacterized protein